jgi:hypothetical protein
MYRGTEINKDGESVRIYGTVVGTREAVIPYLEAKPKFANTIFRRDGKTKH